jgi:outer membrane protein assembly factor BamE (lipoprotein component of BamABCDE complex)
MRNRWHLWVRPFVFLAFLSSCVGGSVATQQDFASIAIGSSIAQVQERVGTPYEIEQTDDGTEVYHYIERIEIGPNATTQNNYVLTVSKGVVIDKTCSSYSPALVQIRSP